jgi:uncharacterized membrane protein
MIRRRPSPWIHRNSRFAIAAVAALGALDTFYLTLVEWGVFKEAALCPTSGIINCNAVLLSDYAKVFGVPLSLFGFLAYTGMAIAALLPLRVDQTENKQLRSQLENWTWLLIFALAIAMTVFSGYLTYLMAFKIKAFCIYCLASVLFSIALLVLTLIGRAWEDIGQLFFIGLMVGMIALIGSLGIYASTNASVAGNTNIPGESGPPITTTSGPAELALASHLKQIGAKEYGAYWCPHCHEQKLLFGKEAQALLNYIECDPKGKNGRPDLCRAANITGYPTWEINGQLHSGVQSLAKLAELSGYTGDRNFKNSVLPR